MKKILIISIVTYLLFTINSTTADQNSNTTIIEDEKILKIGVLLPLTGKFQGIGESFLKSIQLALFDIGEKNIKIYPKDSGANASTAYTSAKEFEKLGIQVVIGPIFFESLERLNEINDITFISFTNKIQQIPKNTISFGINIKSQINTLKEYFNEIKISETLLLSPKLQFNNQTKIIADSEIKFKKIFLYDSSPKKITGEIEKLTNYKERKKDLERRINILKESDLHKDKKELKELEQRHTLGKANFDSVVVIDFGERLKSVLTSFMFSDISNEEIFFFTLNQWFDESLFTESALQNLYFPAIDLGNLEEFKNKYFSTFDEKANEVSILAYDAVGLIYYCWYNNDSKFETNQLYNKNGFKGLHGEFVIKNNISEQKLKLYKISEKKFVKVY